MNTRRLPGDPGATQTTTNEPCTVTQPLGVEPGFQPVGVPWRYEFPRQPSSSDPSYQPSFTVPVPLPQSETIQTPMSPSDADLGNRKSR